MESIELSLDVESVLADINPYFFKTYNARHGTTYSRDEKRDWNWVREEIEFAEFSEIIKTLWTDDRGEVRVTEPTLGETVTALTSHDHITVDIVTGHVGIEDEMQTWLANQGITGFREFISTHDSKADLGYDVYIDDNPQLADALTVEQHQYIVRVPWNHTAWDHPRTTPVDTVREATNSIIQQTTNE